MASQGHDAAARAAHVAQQQLQDGAGADVLHTDAVLGPADAVDQCGGPLAPQFAVQASAELEERCREMPHACSTISGV